MRQRSGNCTRLRSGWRNRAHVVERRVLCCESYRAARLGRPDKVRESDSSEAHADVEQDVDLGDVALALEDVAPGIAPLDAEAAEEGAAAAGHFVVGVAGDQEAADNVGTMADF